MVFVSFLETKTMFQTADRRYLLQAYKLQRSHQASVCIKLTPRPSSFPSQLQELQRGK
jgi:hypothetical protein